VVDALVGSTGFVGSQLLGMHEFDLAVHRPDVATLRDRELDLLVCAGLPAAKWQANADPGADWENMAGLAATLATVRAQRAVLISTIDVYQPAVSVDESVPATFNGAGAYGTHRAWFESFFQARFPGALVLRLPGLFGPGLRKNLVFDLLHGRSEQYVGMNPQSRFQFFDTTKAWQVIETAWEHQIRLLNVSSEPVTAAAVADLFGVALHGDGPQAAYDMRSQHDALFGGRDGYLFSQESVLAGIAALRDGAR
jgi:nucleoside-diphosphate-sugar epimerase